MDASGARSEISLWDLGRGAYVPGGVGFVDQLRVRLDELLRLVHVAVRGSFPDVVHGLLLGLAGLSSHDDDLPGAILWDVPIGWSIGGRVTRRRRERWRFTGGYRAITVRWDDRDARGACLRLSLHG